MAKISNERKVTYYIGIGMMVLGFILFVSVFFSAASLMNDPFGSTSDGLMGSMFGGGDSIMGIPFRRRGPSFTNSIVGLVLMIAGGFVMNIGARGAAGSGLLLDPEKAREDLKPFNDAKGGMINDVISNIDVVDKITRQHEEKEVIKIRCRNCESLNDEDAKFCKNCGKEL